MSSIQLIVGLGNPGPQYANTRHNAGAWFVELLAEKARCNLRPESKFHGMLGTARLFNQEFYLFIPTTYMNESGIAVRAIANYYKILPENILIVHDEIDLPPGIIRLKFDGGTGGHNGLSDIIDHLQSKKFHRLRVGVGHPGNQEAVVDYVLSPPSKAEKQSIEATLQQAEEALPLILEGHFQKAMQVLHSPTQEE